MVTTVVCRSVGLTDVVSLPGAVVSSLVPVVAEGFVVVDGAVVVVALVVEGWLVVGTVVG